MKKFTWVLCLTLGIFMLAGCGANDDNTDNNGDNKDMAETMETVALYFGERDRHALVKEERRIMMGDSADPEARAKVLMEELVKGPSESRGSAVLPPDTKISNVKVENGLATVDIDNASLKNLDTAVMEPQITADAIVATLTRLDGIERVKLTAGGSALKLGTMEFADELTVDTALQQNIDEEDSKVNNGRSGTGSDMVDEMMEDGKDVVDDMVEGGKDVVDDMKDAGRNMINDEKDMMEDGKNAVKNSLGIDNNNNNNNNNGNNTAK